MKGTGNNYLKRKKATSNYDTRQRKKRVIQIKAFKGTIAPFCSQLENIGIKNFVLWKNCRSPLNQAVKASFHKQKKPVVNDRKWCKSLLI